MITFSYFFIDRCLVRYLVIQNVCFADCRPNGKSYKKTNLNGQEGRFFKIDIIQGIHSTFSFIFVIILPTNAQSEINGLLAQIRRSVHLHAY